MRETYLCRFFYKYFKRKIIVKTGLELGIVFHASVVTIVPSKNIPAYNIVNNVLTHTHTPRKLSNETDF